MKLRPNHEFALGAAARVSCCAALISGLGCHPNTTTEPGGDESVEETQTTNSTEAPPPVVVEPDPYIADPELDPSLNTPPVSEERLALNQCQTELRRALTGGGLGSSHDACCRAVAQTAWGNLEEVQAEKDYAVWIEVQDACCELINNAESACTPWGPPMPPSFAHTQLAAQAGGLDLRGLARSLQPAGLVADEIEAELRARAISTWRARMVNEHGSAPVFEGLVNQLEGLVARGLLAETDLRRARDFAAQERRHGALCGAVVQALGGVAQAQALPAQAYPSHPDADSELEACLRNVLSICCLSETVAVALIAAEREDMPQSPLRELLTGIWSDECGHANYGWRLLAKLLPLADAPTRAKLGTYLRLAFAELERHELAHLPTDARTLAGGEHYGLCDGREARVLFYATVQRVIIPALDALDLPAQAAWDQRKTTSTSLAFVHDTSRANHHASC